MAHAHTDPPNLDSTMLTIASAEEALAPRCGGGAARADADIQIATPAVRCGPPRLAEGRSASVERVFEIPSRYELRLGLATIAGARIRGRVRIATLLVAACAAALLATAGRPAELAVELLLELLFALLLELVL
jgi:hypothetical protein